MGEQCGIISENASLMASNTGASLALEKVRVARALQEDAMNKLHNKVRLYLAHIVSFVVVMGFLASCTTMKTTKLYEDRQLHDDEIAHIFSKEDRILVHSINGVKSPDGKETYGPSKFELLPGDYTLTVSFRRNFAITRGRSTVYYRSSSTRNLDVRVRTEAGHTYLLTSQHYPEREEWYAVVMDQTQKRKTIEVGPQPSKTVRTFVATPPPRGG